MSKIIIPLHLAKLTTTPTGVQTGFKKFYLKGEWFKLYDGITEKDVVLDRPLDNYIPLAGTITSNDTVLSAIEKLDYAVSNFVGGGAVWGGITGTLSAQTDLINYLSSNYYPLSSNPAGYLTQDDVQEYADLASFPVTGTIGVIYIALDTELFYIWDGAAYVLTTAPDTGITGGGIINRIPKFTPDGVTIGNSNFSDNGLAGRYSIGSSYVEFITGSNIYLRLNRTTTNRMDFILGNPGLGQTHQITSSNSSGFELISTFGPVILKSGTNEGVRVLDTGKLQFAQTPDIGTTSDFILLRDSSGNVKQIAYPTIPSVSGYVPYIGATSNVNLGVYGLTSEYLQLNTTPTTYTPAVGRIGWNDTDGTLEFKLKGNNVTLQIGQEQVTRVVNKTTPLIDLLEANYQVCVVSGATGQRVSVRLAQADSDANSAGTLGVVTENINANQEGFITTSGQVREINTTGSLQGETWSDGDILYLSPTTAGAITNIKPTAPNHTVIVGYVEYAHAIHGKIYVKIDNGYELDELHNVKITSPLNNDYLSYNSNLSLWENKKFIPIKNLTTSTVTGTLLETIVMSQLVPANTFFDEDIVYLNTMFSRNIRTSAWTVRIYVNTVNNLVGATNIAVYNGAANIGFLQLDRYMLLKSNFLKGISVTGASPTSTTVTAVGQSFAYNPTQAYYWIITIQPNVVGDTATHDYTFITTIK